MKQNRKTILVRGLAAFLFFSAAGCGSGNTASGTADSGKASDAGKYTALGIRMDNNIVETDSLAGNYIDLAADGTGYLYFGDDNQGNITSWETNGSSFSMKAGVSEFAGTVKNGILDLSLGDDIVVVYAKEGTDTSSLNVMTLQEYQQAMTEDNEAKSGGSPAGKYSLYAVKSGDLCILIPDEDKDSFAFDLNEDGTGSVYSDGEAESVIWKLDGDKLSFYEVNGQPASDDYEITLKDGIMTFFIPGENGEDDIWEYLTRDDADTSEIDKDAIDPTALD